MVKDIYNLYINREYKDIYNIIKDNPKLLETIIFDNKTIIHYIIQINNIKLLNKFIKLDINCINKININLDKNDVPYFNMYPHYALELSLFNIFFYLMDKLIKINDLKIFSLSFDNYNITLNIINKNNIDLLNKYINKYNNYILWYNDNISYLQKIILAYYNNKSSLNIKGYVLIDLIKNILKQKNLNYEKFFKYPLNNNALFILIYYYYNPEIYLNSKNILTIDDIKNFILLYPEQINYTNKRSRTIIFYIIGMNDIKLLDFCIKNNGDLNTKLDYENENLCHCIMRNSNNEMLEYILNNEIDIDYNFPNSYNETPIYNLLKNINNIDIKYIKNLLLKTNDWDKQDVFGNSIIHILCTKPYIEELYDCLKMKYFNINLKNYMNDTPIDNLIKNFTELKYNDINNRILKFKMLVIKNFYNDYIKTNKLNINKKCLSKKINYNINDKCTKYLLSLLDKSTITNKDNYDENYNRIVINDYPFSYYNLYNARIIDILIYILIIIKKFQIISIPFNNIFELNRIFELSNINEYKTYNHDMIFEYLNNNNINLEYNSEDETFNFFIKEFKKMIFHNYLYNLNIYVLQEKYYIIPYNLLDSIINNINNYKVFIISILHITDFFAHANILLIDIINKRIIHFEPIGGIDIISILDNTLIEIFKKNDYFKNFKYYKPQDYMPRNGLQRLSLETNNYLKRRGDIDGFCVAWCILFIELYIQNYDLINIDKNFEIIIYKVIKKIINNGILITEYIRNYANYLHNKLVLLLIKNHYNYFEIYYNEINSAAEFSILQFINNYFKETF